MPINKEFKEERNRTVGSDGKELCTFWKNFTEDVSTGILARELLLGASSGWLTGFVSVKAGKLIALSLGGSFILLKIAQEKGYIRVNWSKVNRNIDKITDTIDKKVTGHEPTWTEKMDRYVDKKLDTVEDKLRKKQSKVKRWYSNFIGEPECKLKESHIFVVAFAVGVALGIKTAF